VEFLPHAFDESPEGVANVGDERILRRARFHFLSPRLYRDI
jgi:hypothetical protein